MVKPRLPEKGLAALSAYIDRAWPVVDALPPNEQLRLRSAITLRDRLDFCIQENIALNGAMFSPADLWALKEIAAASLSGGSELLSLARAIDQEIRRLCSHPPHDR